MRIFLLLFLAIITETVLADDRYPRNTSIDILHYRFVLDLNDSTDRIVGQATITIKFKAEVSAFELDFTSVTNNRTGMLVRRVLSENSEVKFNHTNNRLRIALNTPARKDDVLRVVVEYSGIPGDGLIIGRNKFGDRTFFGDNWPDRAHHWLPVIDHPYEKATCEFIVTAPEHYTVIATGEKVEETAKVKSQKTTYWRTSVSLPTKVMVIGVARFAIQYENPVGSIPLQSWVYPQNREAGFKAYAIAAKPMEYLIKTVGPYPYEKLANVQSTTTFGGMENAGNIFYYENSIGSQNIEGLVAHEVAHQWFGDSASEDDWYHVWLSEGFSTYFALLYMENTYGHERLVSEIASDRSQVTEYYRENQSPVVDRKSVV